MGLTWLTTSETAGLLGMPERTVRWQLDKGQFKSKTQDGRGRAGKIHLVALESLPREAQQAYLKGFLEEVQAGREADDDIDFPKETAPEQPASSPDPERINSIAGLVAKYGQTRAEEILSQAAQEWEEVVKAALEIKHDRDKDKTGRAKTLAADRGVHFSTLYRKRDAYEKSGILGLVDDRYLTPGEGLEGKVRRSVNDEAIRWIRARSLMIPPPTTVHIYKELTEIAPKKGWHLPSRSTVYRVIGDILLTEKKLGQRGDKEYEAEMMPKVKRDYTNLLAMEEIVGDGHPFDLFVEWQGRAVRPQLSCWEDMRTRKIVGWCISPTSNSETIALALRHAIITNGLPARLYTDNGKDYLSHYLLDVCRRLQIETRNCIPKTPRSKMIERLFRTVHDQFSLYQPGYCGNKPENRPPDFNEKKLLKAKKLRPMEQFVAKWAAYVEEYNNQEHSALGDAPVNVFEQVPHVRPGKIDIRDLDILMMRCEGVRVQDGCIRFMGRDFWSHNIDLGRIVGEKVQLWYDPNRIGEALIYYKGKFIGTVENKKALAQGESRADLAAELKAGRLVKKAVKQQIASYIEGIEDVLPEEVVKKAQRTRRYYSGDDAAGQAKTGDIPRLTGREQLTRQARQTLDKARAQANQDEESPAKRKYSRAEKMLLERGDRVLAGN